MKHLTLFDYLQPRFATYRRSYAPSSEDIILYKMLHSVEKGFYVDVGAASPFDGSCTLFFYEMGWNGINIDPREDMMALYKAHRPRDINYCCAVSNKETELLLWESLDGSSVSRENVARLRKEHPERVFNRRPVKALLLSRILKEHAPEDIHFLKIDVEDHEREVLEGMDFTAYRPWVLTVESTLPYTTIPSHDAWEHLLTRASFEFFTAYRNNRYYVAEERRRDILENFISMPAVPYIDTRFVNTLRNIRLGR